MIEMYTCAIKDKVYRLWGLVYNVSIRSDTRIISLIRKDNVITFEVDIYISTYKSKLQYNYV